MKAATRDHLLDDRWGKLRYFAIEVEKHLNVAHLFPDEDPSRNKAFFNFRMALGGVGLVQPFDWVTWDAPALTAEMASTLTYGEAWRHATRIVRGDRFCEGAFDAHLYNGSLVALARRVYFLRETDNGWPKAFSQLDDIDLETGIHVEGRRAGQLGMTTGFREKRTTRDNPGWDFQVLWNDETCTMEDINDWHLVLPLKTLAQLTDRRGVLQRR